MEIKLSKPFAANTAVDEFDVRQVKKTLNRLGYYQPYEKTGIIGIPDAGVFAALKAFQKDQGLQPTGAAKPDDDTVKVLNKEASKTPEGSYIWRTVEDDKVRSSHAAFNRTVRDWSDHPDPGEEFNCRCWAEPVDQAMGLHQELISEVNDANKKWNEEDFSNHFYHGKGKTISLSETGYLKEIIEKAREVMFRRVEEQVADKMREIKSGKLVYTTERAYSELHEVFWVFGGGTIRTKTVGTVTQNGNILSIEAIVDYEYDDTFTDPANIRQKKFLYSTSDPKAAPLLVVKLTDAFGTYFQITDRWKTKMMGSIDLNERD